MGWIDLSKVGFVWIYFGLTKMDLNLEANLTAKRLFGSI